MYKAITFPSILFSAVSGLDWAVRCDFESTDCSGNLLSCAQFKLTDGCANDGTGITLSDGQLTVEEGACGDDGVLSFTDLASVVTSGDCITTDGDDDEGTITTYQRYYATDDGSASLRSYTLSDLASCSTNIYPNPSDNDFIDTYITHSDPFYCTSDNTVNIYSYVSKNNTCDVNGILPIIDDIYLTVSEYDNQTACEDKSGDPDVYYYRADGSCHIGMYKSVSNGLLYSHVQLCGEPATRAAVGSNSESDTSYVCGTALTKSNGVTASGASVLAVTATVLALNRN